MPLGQPVSDEQTLARDFSAEERRLRGRYFTPAPLVQEVLASVERHLPDGARLAVVDPSCGAGAFLTGAQERFPAASLHGLEVDPEVAAYCRGRLPRAHVVEGDALRGGLETLLASVPEGAFPLVVGNPPYNGTSPVLKDAGAYARLQALLPSLPKGTSLRDDYAFFLLLCLEQLKGRRGALALVTSATLLDAFLYAPLRHALLEGLQLREVMELGKGVFEDTQVRTCVTVWTSRAPSPGRQEYRRRDEAVKDALRFCAPVTFKPTAPDWTLRPEDGAAAALDRRWAAQGERLSTLVPVSFPGLKTRFDELLVDNDPERLLARVGAFVRTPVDELEGFAREHGIPERHHAKLRLLREGLEEGLSVDPTAVRRFFRYAGAKHRGALPDSCRAYCYLDRRLIPRGDHRQRGAYDPHGGEVKLVFNARELPLSAALLEETGCVHAHRHARFAPLFVPQRLLDDPGARLGPEELTPLVSNLSEAGRAFAKRKRGPLEAFRALAAFINSREVQEVWAPAYGTHRDLPVPLDAI